MEEQSGVVEEQREGNGRTKCSGAIADKVTLLFGGIRLQL